MRTHSYPGDVTDAQWALIEPRIPALPGGRPRQTKMRDVVDAIFYILRTGCQWRYLPRDFPPKSTVWYDFKQWRSDGTLGTIRDLLRNRVRTRERPYHPRTSASVDSQSIDTTSGGEQRGRDNAKDADGRKRHIVVDSMGLLLAALVTAASVDDAAAAPALFVRLDGEPMGRSFGCTPTRSITISNSMSGLTDMRSGTRRSSTAPRGSVGGYGCRSGGRWSGRSPGWAGVGG